MEPDIMLTVDLRLLAYSALLCVLLWIPYTLAGIGARGLTAVMGYPTGIYDDLPDWARRSQRAHMNLIENLAPFAAVVLAAEVVGASNEITALGARLFFWGRVAQAVAHIAGIPYLRTLAFTAAWIGTLLIAWQVIVAGGPMI